MPDRKWPEELPGEKSLDFLTPGQEDRRAMITRLTMPELEQISRR